MKLNGKKSGRSEGIRVRKEDHKWIKRHARDNELRIYEVVQIMVDEMKAKQAIEKVNQELQEVATSD